LVHDKTALKEITLLLPHFCELDYCQMHRNTSEFKMSQHISADKYWLKLWKLQDSSFKLVLIFYRAAVSKCLALIINSKNKKHSNGES